MRTNVIMTHKHTQSMSNAGCMTSCSDSENGKEKVRGWMPWFVCHVEVGVTQGTVTAIGTDRRGVNGHEGCPNICIYAQV